MATFMGTVLSQPWYGHVWNEVFPTFLGQTGAALYMF